MKKVWKILKILMKFQIICESSEEEIEIDDFKNAKEKIENFNETLFPKTNNENIENNRLMFYCQQYSLIKLVKQMFAILKNSKKVSIQT